MSIFVFWRLIIIGFIDLFLIFFWIRMMIILVFFFLFVGVLLVCGFLILFLFNFVNNDLYNMSWVFFFLVLVYGFYWTVVI